jgi:hypothetical protein
MLAKTPGAWWNTLTPSERRAAIARNDPDSLPVISASLSSRWESLPLSAMLATQRCFERVSIRNQERGYRTGSE